MDTLLIIGGLGILVLLLEVFGARKIIIPVAVVGLLVALANNFKAFCSCSIASSPVSHFSNMLITDNYSRGFSSLFIVLTVFLILMSGDFYKKQITKLSDYVTIKLLLLFGGVAMVSFGNMATYFVGIEILSVSLYILAASNPTSIKSNEAGMKYFLMGAFASGFLLFGITLIYGATGSFDIATIAQVSLETTTQSWFYIGIALISTAMLFKIAAFPFHLWAPDVYQGSPALTTALMSTLAKVISIAGFYRLLTGLVGNLPNEFVTVIVVVSILSMTVGNIMALKQTNVKRMLAYSGISHAGFMLMPFLLFADGASYLLYYAAAYAIAGIAAFAVIVAVNKEKDHEDISNFYGLAKVHPVLSLVLTLALLSMAGIPVLAGFFAKVFLFGQMLELGHLTLVIIAVINSIIAVGYYFKLILAMYTKEREEHYEENISVIYTVVAVLAILLNILIGIYPDLVLKLI